MSKTRTVSFDDFTLKKVKISDTGIEADFEEKRVVDDQAQIVTHSVGAKYIPHPDIIKKRNGLREYLTKAYHLEEGYEMAIKYLKGDQKSKAEEKMMDLYDKVEVTGISIGGDEQLRGVVISGKILSNNKSKCAMNTPRIVFSSDKLGYESDVEEKINDLEKEVFAYLFEGKKAQKELFNNDDSSASGELTPSTKKQEKVNQKEAIPSGLE